MKLLDQCHFFAIWPFLLHILFKVSLGSLKWTRVCTSALTINFNSVSLNVFSIQSILILFLSCWLLLYLTTFISLHSSRILNLPMKNHLYTLSFLFLIFLPPHPSKTGQDLMCWVSVQCTSGTLKHLTSPYVVSRMSFLALSPEPPQEFGWILPHFCITV